MVDAAKAEENALRRVVRPAGATSARLRLPNGTVILRIWRLCRADRIRVKDDEAFDPARCGLDISIPPDRPLPGNRYRVKG